MVCAQRTLCVQGCALGAQWLFVRIMSTTVVCNLFWFSGVYNKDITVRRAHTLFPIFPH